MFKLWTGAVVCPHDAITFNRNVNGFYEPTVLSDKCIECGICIKVCYKYLETKQVFENAFVDKPVYGAWRKKLKL